MTPSTQMHQGRAVAQTVQKPAPLACERQPLTARQREVYDFMVDFFLKNDQIPPRDHISWHFQFAGTNGVVCHQKAMERKGWIKRNAVGKYKFVVRPVADESFAAIGDAQRAKNSA